MAFPFAAAAGLADVMFGLIGQGQQQDIAQANLNLQRQVANDNYRLATASRGDPYGNSVNFDGSGFNYDLTPLTQAIMDAQQNEQLRSVTQDATRNRDAAVRRDDRSQSADEMFQKLFAEFSNARRPNEKEAQADSTLRALDRHNSGGDDGRNDLAVQALRMGDRGAIDKINASGGGGGISLAEVMAQGKDQGTAKYLQETQARDGTALNTINQLRGIADGTTNSPIDTSSAVRGVEGFEGQMLQAMMSANNSKAANVGNAIKGMPTGTPLSGLSDVMRIFAQEQQAGQVDPWEQEQRNQQRKVWEWENRQRMNTI